MNLHRVNRHRDTAPAARRNGSPSARAPRARRQPTRTDGGATSATGGPAHEKTRAPTREDNPSTSEARPRRRRSDRAPAPDESRAATKSIAAESRDHLQVVKNDEPVVNDRAAPATPRRSTEAAAGRPDGVNGTAGPRNRRRSPAADATNVPQPNGADHGHTETPRLRHTERRQLADAPKR